MTGGRRLAIAVAIAGLAAIAGSAGRPAANPFAVPPPRDVGERDPGARATPDVRARDAGTPALRPGDRGTADVDPGGGAPVVSPRGGAADAARGEATPPAARGGSPAAVGSPWSGGDAPAARDAAPAGAGQPGRGAVRAPSRRGDPGWTPAPVRALLAEITRLQRDLNAMISREMRAIRETGSPLAFLVVCAVAFAYGVLHAAGPGHGKLVVSSYFLAAEARATRGLAVGGLISLLQVASSTALVGVLAWVIGYAGFDILNQSVWLEVVSYGLIVVVGLVMMAGAITGRHLHRHPHGGRDHARTGLVLAAGLTPCASAIIVLLFALAHGIFLIGVGAAAVMAVGMALTVSLVGVATITARRAFVGSLGARPRAVAWATRGLALAGASLVTVVGSLFLAGAWTRLP